MQGLDYPAGMVEQDSRASAGNVLRRGEVVAHRILEAAIEQLATRGFEALSIPDVAKAAGVHKTTVYRRWPTKNELVRAALQRVMTPAAPPRPSGDPKADLLVAAAYIARFLQSPLGSGLFRMLLSNPGDSELRAYAARLFDGAGEAQLAHIMAPESAQLLGLAREQLRLVLFTLAGGIIHRTFIEQKEASPAYLEQLIDLVLHGVAEK
jgi:AcrR family transcriptional regulator